MITLSVCTDEQPESLALKIRLKGIPDLNQLVGSIGEIQQVVSEVQEQQAEAQEKERQARLDELLNEPAARVVKTMTAPKMDGVMDAIWNSAGKYDLLKTIYVNPGPENKIVASYRMPKSCICLLR